METTPIRKLPVGIQDFTSLIEDGFLYVDKTDLVYRMVTTGKPYFLSRPRRFGKSLLLSTLEAYFLGRKEVFKGLAIEQLEKDWKVYPVLHLSLNAQYYEDKRSLEQVFEVHFIEWEKQYGKTDKEVGYAGRFMQIIRQACEKTGEKVVVLIDEYDKPLLRSFHDENLQEEFRQILTAFYTVLKDADPWLRFVFITGVTKFAQMGIFSNLNQLSDISFDADFAALCGMTRTEIEATFRPEIERMVTERGKTYGEIMDEMTRLYDGYRFSETPMEGMYNPFSVLNALTKRTFRNYWFSSGTPTFLVEMLRKTDFDLRELDGIRVLAASLTDDRADVNNPVPMIYQSGYLTIKDYDDEFQEYTLGFPNEEVKYGFLNFAAQFYTPVRESDTAFYIGKFIRELRSGDAEAFLSRLRAFFAGIPYELNDRTERHYQVVFYLVFRLMGQFAETEVRSAHGRADAIVKTSDYLFVFEFKLNGTAEEALQQIGDRGYLIPFTADSRRLVKIGVEFDAAERNLGRWIIDEEKEYTQRQL